jgi:hypothetical protein
MANELYSGKPLPPRRETSAVGVIIAPFGFLSLLFANPIVGGVGLTTGLMMVEGPTEWFT